MVSFVIDIGRNTTTIFLILSNKSFVVSSLPGVPLSGWLSDFRNSAGGFGCGSFEIFLDLLAAEGLIVLRIGRVPVSGSLRGQEDEPR